MIEFEELEPGRPEPVRRSPARLLGWCALLVLTLAVGAALLRSDPVAPESGSSRPTRSAAGLPVQTVRPGGPAYVALGDVCGVQVDPVNRFAVSFQLRNPSGITVRVLQIEPGDGPGPAAPSTVTSGGTCAQPGASTDTRVIRPGATQLFTIRYQPPQTCPQDLPVTVAYLVDVNGQQLTGTLPVFSALTSVDFAGCPPRRR